MKIINNEGTFKVGWQYTNTVLNKWLEFLGITPAKARKLKGPELNKQLEAVMKLVGAKCIPPPDITDCIVYNEKNEELFRRTVKRQPCLTLEEALESADGLEKHDPEKARVYSLTKVLAFGFPGAENKEVRTSFWKGYFDRRKAIVKTVEAVNS